MAHTFYSKSELADSTVFAEGDGSGRIEVPAVTLDGGVDLVCVSGTGICWVKAERVEPEVLEGKAKTPASVDCDCERDHSFRPHRANLKRVGAHYRNTRH